MITHPKQYSKIVAYANWQSEFLPQSRPNYTSTNEGLLLQWLEQVYPDITIERYFFDGLQKRPWLKFYEMIQYCNENHVELILIPSLQSLSYNKRSLLELIAELQENAPNTHVYFACEEMETGDTDFNLGLSFQLLIKDEMKRYERRKKKLMALAPRRR